MDGYKRDFGGEKEEYAIGYSLFAEVYGYWYSWEDCGVDCYLIIEKINVNYGWYIAQCNMIIRVLITFFQGNDNLEFFRNLYLKYHLNNR